MTTNKCGTVNQQPLYCCTSCYEHCTWPAGDLRVYGNECWCDLCWDVRLDDFPGQPQWADLKPYTPVEQQPAPGVSVLVEAAAAALDEIEKIMHEAYNSAEPVCCGRAGSECCGSPEPEWSEHDQNTMDRLSPHQSALTAALSAHRKGGEA